MSETYRKLRSLCRFFGSLFDHGKNNNAVFYLQHLYIVFIAGLGCYSCMFVVIVVCLLL